MRMGKRSPSSEADVAAVRSLRRLYAKKGLDAAKAAALAALEELEKMEAPPMPTAAPPVAGTCISASLNFDGSRSISTVPPDVMSMWEDGEAFVPMEDCDPLPDFFVTHGSLRDCRSTDVLVCPPCRQPARTRS